TAGRCRSAWKARGAAGSARSAVPAYAREQRRDPSAASTSFAVLRACEQGRCMKVACGLALGIDDPEGARDLLSGQTDNRRRLRRRDTVIVRIEAQVGLFE